MAGALKLTPAWVGHMHGKLDPNRASAETIPKPISRWRQKESRPPALTNRPPVESEKGRGIRAQNGSKPMNLSRKTIPRKAEEMI